VGIRNPNHEASRLLGAAVSVDCSVPRLCRARDFAACTSFTLKPSRAAQSFNG